MRYSCITAFCLSFLLGIAGFALGATPMETRIQECYEHLTSFSADFTQTLNHKESGTVEERQGTLLFQKPLRIRWQTRKPHEETLVVTAKEIWDYLPEEEVAYRYPLDLVRDSRSVIQVVTGQAALSKDFDIKDAGMDSGLVKLRLYPKDPTPQMVEAEIWVDADKGYIRRAHVKDFYGNTNDVRFTRFTPDASIKASSFTFTPPKGIDVEDRIHNTVRDRELFN